ncbi:hypothetical protein NPIL_524571 [Nephila pilipes]|uniref:Uncharacterized protein n=1 Tax=Nephila pilipes TaxID=299642 RepID=A0A8X6UR23_NEPPI|nr:hypothetical protein NPIL_524571 [Nephila pilipes]
MIIETSTPNPMKNSSDIIYVIGKRNRKKGFDDMQTEGIGKLMIDKPLDENDLIDLITKDHNTYDYNCNHADEDEIRQLTASLS